MKADALAAWRAYTRDGSLAKELLREPIFRAWERSHRLGANPTRSRTDALSEAETQALLTQESSLIRAALPYMRLLSQAMRAERHAVVLGDRRAVVLAVIGDEQSVRGPDRVPGPGCLCSEEACGANGLGTSLAEGHYTEIVGAEHFASGFHHFTCQGMPIRDLGGAVVGVLSASVRRAEASARIKTILLFGAIGIEADLIANKLLEHTRRLIEAGSANGPLLEKLRQDLVQASNQLRLQGELAVRFLGRSPDHTVAGVVQFAEGVFAVFRRRALLWEDLASEERGMSTALNLGDLLNDIADFLNTEMVMRRVELLVDAQHDSIVFADRRSLLRLLVEKLFQSADHAGAGGRVTVAVQVAKRASGVIVEVTPYSGRGRLAGPREMLSVPRAELKAVSSVPPADRWSEPDKFHEPSS